MEHDKNNTIIPRVTTMPEEGALSAGRSEMGTEGTRLTSGLSVRHPLEGPFRPSLPFVLSEYLTAEERRQEKMRRKFEVTGRPSFSFLGYKTKGILRASRFHCTINNVNHGLFLSVL